MALRRPVNQVCRDFHPCTAGSRNHKNHLLSYAQKLQPKSSKDPSGLVSTQKSRLNPLDQLELPGARIGSDVSASLVQWCVGAKALWDGRRVHVHLVKCGISLLEDHLVYMYLECGAMEDAMSVFNTMDQKEVSLWNFMIRTLSNQSEGREAFRVFDQMQGEGIIPDKITFVSTLDGCKGHAWLTEGYRMHTYIMDSGYDSDLVVGTALLKMYGKCGSLEDARKTFEKMRKRDLVAWTTMMAAYAQHGQGREAFLLFHQMLNKGVSPDKVTFVSMLHACASQISLAEGKLIHACIRDTGFLSDVIVGTALVNMYGKVGSVEDAQLVFDQMPKRNVLSWTVMIQVYSENGQGDKALEVFGQMEKDGVMPDKVTFVSILDACGSHALLDEARKMHGYILNNGFDSDVVVSTALLNMYGKIGCLEDAWAAFHSIAKRDLVSWNAMLRICAQHGQSKEALQLFKQMLWEGVILNKTTYVTILSVCASHKLLAEGKHIHEHIVNNCFESNVFVGTALLDMYGKCSSLESAQLIFDKMPKQDVHSWNAIIGVYVQHGLCNEAFKLFHRMRQEESMPDKVTFSIILAACVNPEMLVEGKQLHASICDRGLEFDLALGNALIHAYGKCGSLDDARWMFHKIPNQDVVSWTTIITVEVQYDQCKEAVQLLKQMQEQGLFPDKITFVSVLTAFSSQVALAESKWIHACILHSGLESDVVVATELIHMYGRCGSVVDAQKVFDRMHEWDGFAWDAMTAVQIQYGQGNEALQLFDQMQLEGYVPDRVIFISMLAACSSEAKLAEGERMHARILHSGFELDVVIGNALVNMYGRCGSLQVAHGVFNRMSERSVASWNAMIGLYAQHGQGKQALILFEEMCQEGEIPDEITFVSILAACSRAGLVNEARLFFNSMSQNYGISPVVEHYACIIDLLGRAGRVDEAEKLINDMPFNPTFESFMALLGACKHQTDVARGERAADRVFELDLKDPAPFVILSNIYAAAGRAGDAAEMMTRMRNNNLRKELNCHF